MERLRVVVEEFSFFVHFTLCDSAFWLLISLICLEAPTRICLTRVSGESCLDASDTIASCGLSLHVAFHSCGMNENNYYYYYRMTTFVLSKVT